MEKMNPPSSALAERLTRRELTILARLAEDKSDREIAALETLALSSVKWYTHQIYAKLGVTRRSEAVQRARELGLLQPAPASIPKNNLPVQLTSFIGRQKEIGELRLLLRKKNTRLLTLTGSGGTGKTRLALEVAAGIQEAFPNGVWLVELAPLADPLMVPQTVIAALGQVEQPGKIPIQQLADYLREKRLLLLLDNCEHLVQACAELAAALLHAAPHLTVLASSREILGVAGEVAYRVPPLGTPDPRKSPSLEELARFEAVQLFVERARVVSPEFALTRDNAASVAQITRRLDGIPLALELAAARLRLLSAEQVAERLSDAFRLLTGGSRTALPRHQTLTALIDWSYNLLTEAERGLLRSLSAFAGGCTLEAAEEVCEGGYDVLDLLGRLADKSLIMAEPARGGEMRYRMLETVRQYAHARLVEAGEAEGVRARHLAYYLRLAERLEPKLRSQEQIVTLDYWEGELGNLRLALEWALQGDVEAELRLAASLQWFWHIRYHWVEGISWLEEGLAADALRRGGLPPAGSRALIRAKALTALGFHVLMRDSEVPAKAKPSLQEALVLYRTSGLEHRLGLAWDLLWLGDCARMEGDPVQARLLAEEGLSLFRETGDPHGMAESLELIVECEIDPVQQRRIYQELLAIEEANGDVEGIASVLNFIGFSNLVDGEYEHASAAFKASREHYREVGNPKMVAQESELLGIVSLLNGELQSAVLYQEEALVDFREMANDDYVAFYLFWKCLTAFAQGDYDQAAELNEEAGRIAQKTGAPETLAHVFYLRARLARLRGDSAAARSYAEEGMNAARDLGDPMMLLLLELGHLALHDGDLDQARKFFAEGVQVLTLRGNMGSVGWSLDGLAVLAVRERKLERAARLFGTRQCRGFAHTLSPIERAEREADFEQIKAGLGEERFARLREEGSAMTFEQLLALAQEEG